MFNCRQKPLQSPINLEALLLKVERKILHDLKHGKHDHDDENGLHESTWKPKSKSRRLQKLQHEHHGHYYDVLQSMFGDIELSPGV